MVYVEESLVMFDKINGRFISTEIIGKYKYSEVSEFYKNSPKFGMETNYKKPLQRGRNL